MRSIYKVTLTDSVLDVINDIKIFSTQTYSIQCERCARVFQRKLYGAGDRMWQSPNHV